MSAKKLGLGTVQWGMKYGVSNSCGRTGGAEISKILTVARESGLSLIDTAALYGEAEKALGQQQLEGFRLVTKTPRFAKGRITDRDAKTLVETLEKSLGLLRTDHVYALLVHHVEDVLVSGGEYLIEAMASLKDRGLVKRVGASIYDSRNLELVVERLRPDIVQLPLNVLDQRLIEDGSLDFLRHRGVEIHARSAFLQGLLLMPLNQIPDYFTPWRSILDRWNAACDRQGVSPLQAALGYVTRLDAIDYCILGVESASHLQQCLLALQSSDAFDASGLSSADTGLVNPMNWRLS